MQPVFLKIFHQGKLLKVKPFSDEQISIGSGDGLTLKLKGLSPWHVLIERKLNKYTIFDLGSETGTLVGGKKISGEVQLKSQDFIALGEYQIQFFIGPPQDDSSLQAEGGSEQSVPSLEVPSVKEPEETI